MRHLPGKTHTKTLTEHDNTEGKDASRHYSALDLDVKRKIVDMQAYATHED